MFFLDVTYAQNSIMFVFSAVKSIGSVQIYSPTKTLTQIYLVITPFSHMLTAILIWYPSRQYTKNVKQVSMYFWNKFHFLTKKLWLKYNSNHSLQLQCIYILSSHSTLLYLPSDSTCVFKAFYLINLYIWFTLQTRNYDVIVYFRVYSCRCNDIDDVIQKVQHHVDLIKIHVVR